MAKSDKLTTTDKGATALVTPPSVSVGDVFADAADTKLNFQRDDLAIPFLRVLQKGSPEVNPRDPKYIQGAQQGFFFNTVTKQIWDGEKGILLVPVAFTKSFVEWKLRENGGGFVKDHGGDASILQKTTRDDRNRDMTADGTQITRSALYYVMQLQESGDFQTAAFALSSTQLKKANAWNSVIAGMKIRNPENPAEFRTPRPYYWSYKVTTVPESNEKGDWMGVKIETYKPVLELEGGSEIYLAAKDYEAMVLRGAAKLDIGNMQASEDDPAPTADAGKGF